MKACPAVCALWQIFFRDPIPADAESIAPLHDLRRDLGQVLLAEAGVPEVGVKACHRQDGPFAIILPVGKVIADQRTDNLGWNFLRKRRFHFLCQFRRQLRPLSAQRSQLQRIGKDIVKAQRPGTLGLGCENRDLILHHLASPCGGKLGLNDLRILERGAAHLFRVRQYEVRSAKNMAEKPAGPIRIHQLRKFRV